MTVTHTDSIALLVYCVLLQLKDAVWRDHHPRYSCIGRGWAAGLRPQAVNAATSLTALRAMKLRDSAALI